VAAFPQVNSNAAPMLQKRLRDHAPCIVKARRAFPEDGICRTSVL
jgi:hypothetical protein